MYDMYDNKQYKSIVHEIPFVPRFLNANSSTFYIISLENFNLSASVNPFIYFC